MRQGRIRGWGSEAIEEEVNNGDDNYNMRRYGRCDKVERMRGEGCGEDGGDNN